MMCSIAHRCVIEIFVGGAFLAFLAPQVLQGRQTPEKLRFAAWPIIWNSRCVENGDGHINLVQSFRTIVMSATGLSEFDHAVHQANLWLKDMMRLTNGSDRHRAYFVLRTLLHELRDHLPVDAAVALGAQLPMLVRGFYYDGWRPVGKPLKVRRREDFLADITAQFGDRDLDSEEATRAVMRLLAIHVSHGLINQIKHCLPADLRRLWPADAVVPESPVPTSTTPE
jgi:uncharacterized protein (DUF2267 family)